ncbi:MAG: hypothetical protein ACKV1O_18205 [Saprospiraceae bacterium]
MKNTILGFFAITLLALSCKKESIQPNCVDQFIESRQLIKYTGQTLNCELFYNLYEFNGKQYYVAGNYCADMASNPVDCDGNFLCPNLGEPGFTCPEIEDFFTNAINKGIIGFEN